MKMRRKGFLAAMAAAIVSPVLAKAKGKGKPKFPRWFALQQLGVIYLRADADDWIVAVHYDGTQGRRVRCTQVYDKAGRRWGPGPVTIQDVEEYVRKGHFREITAAEAKALLRQAHRLRHPKGRHVDSIICDDVITLPFPPGCTPSGTFTKIPNQAVFLNRK